MKKSISRVAIGLAGLLVFVSSLTFVSASPADIVGQAAGSPMLTLHLDGNGWSVGPRPIQLDGNTWSVAPTP